MLPVLETVERRVTSSMNELLLKEFTMDEVGVALNQMVPNKAPGPDGFFTNFYQKIGAKLVLRLVVL